MPKAQILLQSADTFLYDTNTLKPPLRLIREVAAVFSL